MMVPLATAQQSYAVYAASRQGLAIAQGSLLPIGIKSGDIYGLNPNMPEIAALYTAGQAAILANVGMLVISLFDKTAYSQYLPRSPNLPVNVFSTPIKPANGKLRNQTPGQHRLGRACGG